MKFYEKQSNKNVKAKRRFRRVGSETLGELDVVLEKDLGSNFTFKQEN